MRTVCLFIASLGFASAFLAPVPSFTPTRARATQTSMMLSPEDIATGTSNLLAIVKENDVFVKNAGDYPWGSVQAPSWALPVAAIATLSFGVIIPLVLKPGVDAFNTGGAKGAEKIASSTKAPSRPGAKPAAGKAGKRVMAKGGVPKKK
ncbi:hypothetical protein NSK_000765 [Nannochloropsis salina CCMP1776]|uniref:Uncharacterized protein n=1 Tax=Nannochloropsis salina CCMP1776 TaxID=1027361 RepID=A0A4D9DAT4_9STRA|nr:hypothetical protein NSK_000765 [Nannochloropsis salina CCMP1776]|eukprot:TFJ88416.1 hypothetical protein NSK_000765 [Nannochloropsis salina CCMP1776]